MVYLAFFGCNLPGTWLQGTVWRSRADINSSGASKCGLFGWLMVGKDSPEAVGYPKYSGDGELRDVAVSWSSSKMVGGTNSTGF